MTTPDPELRRLSAENRLLSQQVDTLSKKLLARKKPAQPDRLTLLCRELDTELDGVQLPQSAASIVNAIRELVWKE